MNVTAKMDQAGANDRDRALRERAQRVIPGGMWGHMNAARLPPEYPQYFAKAEGARIWDVNGRDYVDFMCAWGPMVLGSSAVATPETACERQVRQWGQNPGVREWV